jgi:hypothetical protein
MVQCSSYLWGHDKAYHVFYILLFLPSCSRRGGVFEGARVSASSLGLASFFGSIISHFRSYHNTTTLCSHHHLSSHLSSYLLTLTVLFLSPFLARALLYSQPPPLRCSKSSSLLPRPRVPTHPKTHPLRAIATHEYFGRRFRP